MRVLAIAAVTIAVGCSGSKGDKGDGGGAQCAARDAGVSAQIATDATNDRIAADAVAVYFFDRSLHAIVKVPLAGGAPTMLAPLTAGRDVAVDADFVYYVDASAGTVFAVAKSGGTPTMLGTFPSGTFVNDFIVGGGFVFASVVVGTGAGAMHAIYSLPTSGMGAASIVANDAPRLAVDDAALYWANGSGVMRMPFATGTPTSLSAMSIDLTSGGNLGVGGGTVALSANGSLLVLPSQGGSPRTIATFAQLGQLQPHAIATNGTDVYFGGYATAMASVEPVIYAVPVAGGLARTVVSAEQSVQGDETPESIVLTPCGLFWAGYGGAVWMTNP